MLRFDPRAQYRQLRSLLDLFRQAFGGYKIRIVILTLLGFVSGLLEGIGVNALIPTLSFFTESGEKGDDFVSQMIEKFFSFVGIRFSLLHLLVFISSLFLIKAVARLLINFIRINIRADYERQMRSSLLIDTFRARWPYLLKQKLGYLETVIMTDVRLSAKLFDVISSTIMVLTGLFMYLLFAVNISPPITLLTLGVGGAVFLVFKPLVRRTRQIARKTSLLNKEVAHLVNESVLGIKAVKSGFMENVFAERGDEHFKNLKSYEVKTSLLRTLAVIFLQPISVILISAIFAFSYYFDTSFNFAALAALIYLIHRIFSYIQTLQANTHNMNNLIPYLREVLVYRRLARENKESYVPKQPFKFEQELAFHNVEFAYNPSQPTLSGVSYTIRKGEMVGVIGLSGAGKTTLFDLILRLLEPSGGFISLDGRNISEIDLGSWRSHISYVSQDLFLINDTIAHNIKFYDDSISDEDVVRVAKMAYIYDFIETLPEKFNTIVGERGVRLSGGQRQRIAIARALARRPEILLLDEATSALDNESEIKVQRVIEKLKGHTTIIVVAHRLSTVLNSDKLLVLENGKITEEGAPQELLKDKKSYFYKMYNIRR
jgi:ABC-type multidrug transport system fused ATPase/permease subunit